MSEKSKTRAHTECLGGSTRISKESEKRGENKDQKDHLNLSKPVQNNSLYKKK